MASRTQNYPVDIRFPAAKIATRRNVSTPSNHHHEPLTISHRTTYRYKSFPQIFIFNL
jgi:hypothetical protein